MPTKEKREREKGGYSHSRHNIRNQIDTLLLRSTTNEHKQIRLRVLRNTRPLLCLFLELRSFRLRILIDPDVLP